MKKILNSFWKWYEDNKTINIGFASLLFSLQLVHLYWLTTAVVSLRLFGESIFAPSETFELVITLVDYTEIPAIITTSLLYINEVRPRNARQVTRQAKLNFKALLYLFLINSQWLHILWITDEFVIEHFLNHSGASLLPFWLSWVAIFIDYLELPVIYDTLQKFFVSLKKESKTTALEELNEN